MEFKSDRVCVESVAVGQYSLADLGHNCSMKLRVVTAVQAGKLERTDEKLEQQARPRMIARAVVRWVRTEPESVCDSIRHVSRASDSVALVRPVN